MDCLSSSCPGNKIEMTLEGRVRILATHHKNDRRTNKISSAPIDVTLPMGPLTDLLTFWLEEGWEVVHSGSSCSTAFSSRGGRSLNPKPFSSTNFSEYWSQLVHTTAPQRLWTLTATLARSSFVEAYTRGAEEREWEGAAAVMGNSTSTWKQHYSTMFKNRSMQGAADSFSSFLERDEELEEPAPPTSLSSALAAVAAHPMQGIHPAPPPILPLAKGRKRSNAKRVGRDGQLQDDLGKWVGFGEW